MAVKREKIQWKRRRSKEKAKRRTRESERRDKPGRQARETDREKTTPGPVFLQFFTESDPCFIIQL
eukprot:scaffold45318_cov32-Attheya_sp.AAC.2